MTAEPMEGTQPSATTESTQPRDQAPPADQQVADEQLPDPATASPDTQTASAESSSADTVAEAPESVTADTATGSDGAGSEPETADAEAAAGAPAPSGAAAQGVPTASEAAGPAPESTDTATPTEAAAPTDTAPTTAEASSDVTGTADPSPEAAIGASGARPLGAADSLAAAADAAVEAAGGEAAGVSSPVIEEPARPESIDGSAERGGGDGVAATATATAAPATAVAIAERDDRPEPTTMEELLSEQTDEIRSLKHGDVVEGQVVRIDKDEILVDIGAKSEGVVSNRELYGRNAESQPQLNIGDTVLVYVLQPESNEGHAVLSLRRAGLERKWRAMQEQLDAGVIIEAPVIDHNKGGLIVDCGIRGFVPISQIVDFPRRPQNEQPRDAAQEIAEKLQPYVGRRLRLKILEVNRKANRLILSEKVALYEERREKRDELFSSLQVGQRVKGTVRSIAPFGVFVDLGGIDGLVHKSELSWNKVNNPEAGYRVGEEVEAEVIDINHERGRISLSIRRLQPDPWHSTVADLKVGDIIEGTVTKIVNFGSFVRVRDGLEGLIHISELSHQRVAHPGDVVHEGQKLNLKVISLDSERHRLGLSLKQAEEAPARPAPTAAEPRERRGGRQERSYDASQAVQEPDEGIDNTLAAAFAQVRQQVAESEAAAARVEERATAEATTDAVADVAGAADEAAATADATTAVAPTAEEPAPTAAAAPATEAAAEAATATTEAVEAPEETTATTEAVAAPDEATRTAEAAEPAEEATPTAEVAPAAETTTTEEPAAPVPAETVAEVLAEAPGADTAPVSEAAAAPAMEVAPAPDAKPASEAKPSRSKRGAAAAARQATEPSVETAESEAPAETKAAETEATAETEAPAETEATAETEAPAKS